MTTQYTSWDTHFMSKCYFIAQKSKDTSTKVGCVIVGPDNEPIMDGFNGPPRDFDDNDPILDKRPDKYLYIEHAERNALYMSARIGVSTKGCRLYVTWTPCFDCARGIKQAGITEVIIHKQGQEAFKISRPETKEMQRWKDSNDKVEHFLTNIGVIVRWYDGPIIPVALEGFFTGKRYSFTGENYNPIEIVS